MKKLIKTGILAIALVCSGVRVYSEEAVNVPAEVVEISEDLGGQYCICPELIQAICWRESRFNPDAENRGCIGIMQICPKWHENRMDRLGITELTDIRQNMSVGVDYLHELISDGKDVAEALMIYHGESDARENARNGDISGYAECILRVSEQLERRNGK